MKKLLYLMAFGSLIAFSHCGEDEETTSTLQRFFENAQVSDGPLPVIAGDRTVVNYLFNDPGPENASDAGFAEEIYLGLPTDFNEVPTITNENLTELQFLYTRSCFCAPIDTVQLLNASLNVNRAGTTLQVSGTLSFMTGHFNATTPPEIIWSPEETRNLSGSYSLTELTN